MRRVSIHSDVVLTYMYLLDSYLLGSSTQTRTAPWNSMMDSGLVVSAVKSGGSALRVPESLRGLRGWNGRAGRRDPGWAGLGVGTLQQIQRF